MNRRLQVRDQGWESLFSKPVNVRVASVRREVIFGLLGLASSHFRVARVSVKSFSGC